MVSEANDTNDLKFEIEETDLLFFHDSGHLELALAFFGRIFERMGVGEAAGRFVFAQNIKNRHGVGRWLHTAQIVRFDRTDVVKNMIELAAVFDGFVLGEFESS